MASSGMALGSLRVYPIKSCGGVSVGEWEADGCGLRLDRRWMLVDENGAFISQRRLPRMALIRIRIGPGRLGVEAPGMPELEIPISPPGGKPTLAAVWGDLVEVLRVGEEADRWFSSFLGASCRLVHMPDDSVRHVDPDYGGPHDRVRLADGFPFLLISRASLEDLNARLKEPLPMDRFRPNLVISGCDPYAEDRWRRVRIGGIEFRVVKPCARCAITTVDQRTAESGKEPLRTLATYRKVGSNVLFGQNLIHDSGGVLRVGDEVEVLEEA